MSPDHIKAIDFLLGNREGLPNLKQTRRVVLDGTPVQTSPFRHYLAEVNRFLFSGGLSISTGNDSHMDFISGFYRQSKLGLILEGILERTSVTGEIVVIPRYAEGQYKLNFYESTEFKVVEDKLCILTTKTVDKKLYFYRFEVDSENYYHYDLVDASKYAEPEWKLSKVEPHNYGLQPWQVLKNLTGLGCGKGKTDFDVIALEMCCQLLLQYCAASENFYFFGQPIYVSPDPKSTLVALKKRVRVLQKNGPEDGGAVEMLSRSSMPAEQGAHIKDLANNLSRHLGISVQTEVHDKTDLSYIALKLMNESTIAVAERKWESLVTCGLEPFLTTVSRMGLVDKVWAGNLDVVRLSRKKPYFTRAPKENLDLMSLTERLIDNGVDVVAAFRMGIMCDKSDEEIEHLIQSRLE